jgi:hypothetical protein
MFARGSRYRNLPESAPVDAAGERLVGKDLRFIPSIPGQFLHTVSSHERLDLLAYKYYGDPTRWWQIADANPEFSFPLDLLDRSPVVQELLMLVDPDNARRFQDLLTAVKAVAQLPNKLNPSNTFVVADFVAVFTALATRQQIISAIAAHGFHFLRSFSWSVAGATAEAFTLEDQALKSRWRTMFEGLRLTPGVVELESNLGEATIHVAYNNAMVGRDDIVSKISQRGFAVSPLLSQRVERIGAKIIIPANGAL